MEIYRFCFVLLCIWGQFSKYKPPGGLYLVGRFNGGFFALRVWGAYIWRGLYMEVLIFGILRYLHPYFDNKDHISDRTDHASALELTGHV